MNEKPASTAWQVGDRVLTPSGQVGTVVGVKMVWVQLDGVSSLVYCDVDALMARPEPATPPKGACGVCVECKAGAACTASFRLVADEAALPERVAATLGFISRMRGVDANVDSMLAWVQRLLTGDDVSAAKPEDGTP